MLNRNGIQEMNDTSLGHQRSHAVVIGGSMAGLMAARVLSEYFDRVTIIERDRYPDGPIPRKGVPQARHLHALLLQGKRIVERLFPGICDDMIEAGAHVVDIANDLNWLNPAGWGVRFASDLKMLTFSRGLLDWHVRRHLSQFDQVRFLEESEIVGLLPDSRNRGIAGVRVHLRNQSESGPAVEMKVRADLVIDVSGRGSRAPQWMEALGYERPKETVVNGFLGYASRLYQRTPDPNRDWKGVFVQAAPPARTRGGIIFPIENNQWILTVVGGDKDYPPTDEAGFLEFVRSLDTPLIYDTIKDADPLSSIYGYRATENRLRHYEKISRWPERFMVAGDAACAFNPVYGQGITTAALGIELLDRCLSEQRRKRPDGNLCGMAARFQKRLAKINAAPWALATTEDYRYSKTEGKRPGTMTRFMHSYMDRVIRLTTEDEPTRLALLEAFNLLTPPTSLFNPRIMIKMARRSFTARGGTDRERLMSKELQDAMP